MTQREINNYSTIFHHLLPKFYGKSYPKDHIVIEYINGKTLLNIDDLYLNESDRFTIIFQLMVIIEFLHHNKCIYRDLKPNNVMIDENKNVVLIDLDRMIKEENILNDKYRTVDFASYFAAPEVNSRDFSYQCDVYSLGKMILYILSSGNEQFDFSINYIEVENLAKRCTQKDPKYRPSISEIILEFYIYNNNIIRDSNFYEVYSKYFTDIYDMNSFNKLKQIELNISITQKNYLLGVIYYDGEIVPRNIHKSLHYLQLAADQNDWNYLL